MWNKERHAIFYFGEELIGYFDGTRIPWDRAVLSLGRETIIIACLCDCLSDLQIESVAGTVLVQR